MNIKDLIPFNWRRKRQDTVPVPVTFDPPATNDWQPLFAGGLGGLLGGHDGGIRVRTCDNSVQIEADLPGIAPEDIDLSIEDGQVVIRGECREQSDDSHSRSYRSIQRRVRLPAGADASKAEATQHNGVLTLTLPREAAATSNRIPVQAG